MRTIVIFTVQSANSSKALVAARRIEEKTLPRYMSNPSTLINREIELPFRVLGEFSFRVIPDTITVCRTNDQAREAADKLLSDDDLLFINPPNDDFGILPHQTPKKRLIVTDPNILRKRIAKNEVALQNLQRSLARDREALALYEEQQQISAPSTVS